MGSRMAANLLKAGHEVTVWNRTPAACATFADVGAQVAATPRAAVMHAELAIAMVRDDRASHAVWCDEEHGALAGLPSGCIGIESSTLTVGWVRDLAGRFESRGHDFLDAPVLGSRPQAEAAQLIQLVGGRAEVLARAQPVLRAICVASHLAGAAGDGTALKLVANALFGIQVTALAELIGFINKTGLDPARAVEILGETPVLGASAKGAAASMLSGVFPAMFPVDLAEKDFGYAQATADAAGAPLPVTKAAHAVFVDAMRQGFGADNLTGVVRLYR